MEASERYKVKLSEEYDPLEDLLEESPGIGYSPSPHGPPVLTGIVGDEVPIPEASAENMVCLRGPCKHYWEIRQRFDNMNRGMGPDFAPKQTNRFCTLTTDTLNLTDEVVHECTHWEPLSASEVAEKTRLRKEWREKNDANSNDPE